MRYSRICKADKATDRCTCTAADVANLNHVSEPLIRFLDKANHNDVAEYVVLWVAFKSLNIVNLFILSTNKNDFSKFLYYVGNEIMEYVVMQPEQLLFWTSEWRGM